RPSNDISMNVDFETLMVIAVFRGRGAFCSGCEVDSIDEDSGRLTLRVRENGYQTGSWADRSFLDRGLSAKAWGVFVLPRSNKQIVLEGDTRQFISDQPKWVRWSTFPALLPVTRNR